MDYLKWWTVPTAARYLGISAVATYRTIERGRLHVVPTPLGLLVDPASVEDYARTRRPVRRKGEPVLTGATA
jgi:hypothetical protein